MTLSPTALAAAAKALRDCATLDHSESAATIRFVLGQADALAQAAVESYLAALPPIDAAGLVERLRMRSSWLRDNQEDDEPDLDAILHEQSRDTITRLSREVEEMRGALEPFTRQNIHKSEDGLHGILIPAIVADVRRAKAARQSLPPQEDKP